MKYASLLMLLASVAHAGKFATDIKDLGDRNPARRGAAFYKLAFASSAATDDLVNGLKASSAPVRIQCLNLLGRTRNTKGLAAAANAAKKDSDWMVRREAVSTLSRFDDPRATSILQDAALHDAVINVRLEALTRYSRERGLRAIPFLKKFTADPNIMARLVSARELARDGDASGRELALSSLRARSPYIRQEAIGVLGYIGKRADEDKLKRIADDPKEAVLIRFDARRMIRHMDLAREPAAQQLSTLKSAMADSAQATRLWAASELAERGDSASLAALKEVARDQNAVGRVEAARALFTLESR